MALIWILKRLFTGSKDIGFFSYLSGRDQNKSRIELEKTRHAAVKDLIKNLPDGAIVREGTADSWREIWMPPCQVPRLFVVPADGREQATKTGPTELPAHLPYALTSAESHGEDRTCRLPGDDATGD